MLFIFCRSFGEVWLSVHKKTNKKYAIKSVRRQPNGFNELKRNEAIQQLKNESELLCTLEHPGIVKVSHHLIMVNCNSNESSA